MFNSLRSYHVDYLLKSKADANAVEDRMAPGHFRHRALIVGESEEEVVSVVRRQGGIPVNVEMVRNRFKFFKRVSAEYKKQFLMAIHFNCASMSAARALEAVIESDTSSTRAQLNSALAIIKRGGGFIEALVSLNFFNESTLAILEAGERTGTLTEALHTAVEHLDARAVNNKLMTGMASMAGLEIFMAMSTVVSNRYVMLPMMLDNMPVDATPAKTQEILDAIHSAMLFSDVMMWGTLGLFFVVIMAVYAYFDRDQAFRTWVDDKVMSVPVLSQAILHSAVANSFRVAASLVKGGVHLNAAIAIAEKSTRVPGVMRYWAQARVRSENGDSVAAMLSQSMLDNSDRLLVGAHTDRAQLATSFATIAERRSYMASKASKRFGMVSFFATAVYLTVAVLGSIYVIWIQNESLLSGLKG
ncbi:type II secretion system F family protein [Noviherbaspirillum pedocola]|jgi:type II secretory pathway component PulF|uniref:Type II secretion system F family protein n=1 Tax=Noviherbaspirillum pedocola TaxID=2801341 RepID=A0A934T344_9BURK|nr:type II secretion system F family protein [Noviherbaspirillum pedocola]MBK4738902.1 type II secretion system F family protein [Noviherbaspirillum pedocola]